jgi:hypothetical protein
VARQRLAAAQGELDLGPWLGGRAAADHVPAEGTSWTALGRARYLPARPDIDARLSLVAASGRQRLSTTIGS